MIECQKSGYQKEAIIQAELYVACKKAGLDCDLQYAIHAENAEKDWDIPDLIVVEHDQIICIVEVKDYSSFNNLTPTSREQIKRYRRHGVPVFILYSIYDIPYLVKQLLEVKAKFLESIDLVKAKCFEADKQNEEKWNTKIAAAFIEFNETFLDYKFTNDQSLEIIAIGVKTLGLIDVLRLDEFKSNLAVFFAMFNAQIDYRNGGGLDAHKGPVHVTHTISSYQNRQDHINEKLT